MVGTRIMTDRGATQKGLLQYVIHMVRDEGVGSLYKGFVPNFARIGRWAVNASASGRGPHCAQCAQHGASPMMPHGGDGMF